MKPIAMVNRATTATLSQPAYEAATMKMAGQMAAEWRRKLTIIHRSDESYGVTLTNGCEDLSGIGDAQVVLDNQPITQESGQDRNYPHHHIRQRRVNAIVLDGESQHVAHIFWKICDHNEEAPVVTDLSADQRHHWDAGENCSPWRRWKIFLAFQLA